MKQSRFPAALKSGLGMTRCPGILSRGGSGGDQAAVKLEVVVEHALGSKALAGSLVGAIGLVAAEIAVGAQGAESFGQAVGIVSFEVKRTVSPDFAEAGNIVGDNCAARESSFERSHTKRLITRGGGINRGATIEISQLRFGLRPFQRDRYLLSSQLDVGANRRARRVRGIVRSHDAYRKRVRVLGQQ